MALRVVSVGAACPEHLRLAVEQSGSFSDAFETVRPLTCNEDCFVSLCRARQTRELTVIKAYFRHGPAGAAQQVQAETRIHSRLVHDNIVPLLLAFEDSRHSYLAVQHAEGGDLRQHFRAPMAEQRVRSWLVVPLLEALAAIHKQGVVHRDLKPENVLLHGGKVLLADFGMSVRSRRVSGDCDTPATATPLTASGTPLYTAPEVMRAVFKNGGVTAVVGPKNDIWALGLMVLEALVGVHPFSKEEAAGGSILYTISQCQRINLPSHLSSACRSFLDAALCGDPDKRLDAAALLGHAWLADSWRGSDGGGCRSPTSCHLAAAGGGTAAWGKGGGDMGPVVCEQVDSWEF